MDKKFIKSMVSAIAGLGILSSCSMMGMKDSHKCGGKNSCKGKMMEDSHKCAAKKEEAKKADSNNCSAKKEEAAKVESNTCGAKNGCAAAKAADADKSVKAKKSSKKN